MYEKEIKQVFNSIKEIIKIDKINSIKISKLGLGENNLNLLAVVNDKKFVIRIAMRKDIEKNMKKEFESIKKLPRGFGAVPLYFDNSKNIVPKVFCILTYVGGKHIIKWGEKHLKLHAKKLAELHKKKYPFWGRTKKKRYGFDIYKELLKEIRGYRKDTPNLFKDDDIIKFTPLIKKFMKKKNYLFKSLKDFSLIHADPCLTNILFTKDSIKYIDWEWMQYKDNAMDVAMLFNQNYSQYPWKIKLNGVRLNIYLDEYLKYIDDPTLRERVDIWTIFYKYTDLLFFKWKIMEYEKEIKRGVSDIPKSVYKKHMVNTINSLNKLFK